MASPTLQTLAQLRLAAQQRADMVNSAFVSTTEWNSYINSSLYELYDLLIQKYGDDYFVATPYAFTADGTNQLFALPDDCYKSLGLDVALSSGNSGWVTVRHFMFAERNKFNAPSLAIPGYGPINLQYRINGSNLMFIPTPTAGLQFRLWYVPRLAPLASDGATFDSISGWTEYVVVDAAIKALQKEESDVSALMAQKQALILRIESAAANRDVGSPQRVSDGSWDGGSGFNGNDGSGFGWGS